MIQPKYKTLEESNIYDIIIEDTIKKYELKEWCSSMGTTKWEIPQYSKNQINKAGKTIADPKTNNEEKKNALIILNNWRASHAYPLQVITSNLRRKNPDAIVVQRLKRLDSITSKLERFPEMSLYRMQDLGGCRVILPEIWDVYDSVNAYKNSRIRHVLKREDDYIENPKASGYRSYHMVYKFHSDTKETYNKNMLIEIQFRTRLQHIWATALETMGVYTKTALKASIGNKDILRFFTLVSSVFALMENTSTCPGIPDNYNELRSEIIEINNKLNIISRLSALSVAIKHTNEKYDKGMGYYLLRLDFERKMLNVRAFSTNQINIATEIYNKIESVNNPKIDSVLVSASSFDTLKAAYPNYFTDITDFIDIMRNFLY